jgi:ribonucleoside-diphosphate reductase subunit M2
MTVFDAQSELAAKNLRSTILTRLAEMKVDLKPGEEIILKENNRRFCLFPIKFHEVIKKKDGAIYFGRKN